MKTTPTPWRIPLLAAETLLVFLAFAAIHFAVMHDLPSWPYLDGAYHWLVMEAIWHDGWWRDIDWLPYTVLGDAGPDHHWLYHLLLAPFAAIDDRVLAAHAANAASFALVPASLNLALRLCGVRWAPLWVMLAMATTYQPLFRWSLLRAQTLASAYLVLFIVVVCRRHKAWLVALPFLFMQSYHAAALLAWPALCMAGVAWWRERVLAWQLLALPALGGALALLLSPWYPQNIGYFVFHVFSKVGNTLNLDVGMEWSPMLPVELLERLWPQLGVLGLVVLLAAVQRRLRAGDAGLVALGTTAFVVVLTLQHGRFIEYLPQLVVLSAALLARDAGITVRGSAARAAIGLVCLAAAAQFGAVLAEIHADKQGHDLGSRIASVERFRATSAFVAGHSAPGDVILDTDWGDFPMLVINLPERRFVTGLDPNYLAQRSPDKFIALYKLNGALPLDDGEVIDVRATFGADWVVTRNRTAIEHLQATGQLHGAISDLWGIWIYVGDDAAIIADMAAWMAAQ